MLIDFTRFVIVPDPDGSPDRVYGATITCIDCNWSGRAELAVHEVQSLHCERCGNTERSYAGIPDKIVGVPGPECGSGKTRVECETSTLGRIDVLRLHCAEYGWQL